MPSLVQRSDVSEFRKKFRWLVLFIVVAFAVLIGRLFVLYRPDPEDPRIELP